MVLARARRRKQRAQSTEQKAEPREQIAVRREQRGEGRYTEESSEQQQQQRAQDLEERVKAHEKGGEDFRHCFSVKSCGNNGVYSRYETHNNEGIEHRHDGLSERKDNFFQRLYPLE